MLEKLKEEVCEIAKRAQRDGLCKHKSGNFSARDLESGLIVVTPSGVNRESLTPEDMIVMNMDACVIENKSNLKPTSEVLVHIQIYDTRPETKGIAHTHSMYATSFAIVNKPLPAIVFEVAAMGLSKGRVPVSPYGTPGTAELAKTVVEAAQEAQCFLMEKHGVFAFDSQNVYEAYLKAAYTEELAEMYYHALQINRGVEPDYFNIEEIQGWEYPKEIKLQGEINE